MEHEIFDAWGGGVVKEELTHDEQPGMQVITGFVAVVRALPRQSLG